jgi:hypothetical protein
MKRAPVVVVALALLATACGAERAASPPNGGLAAVDPSAIPVADVPGAVEPGLRQSSPERMAEPIFKPAPEPVAAPPPKPIRSNPPTPPPARRRPSAVSSGPVVPRVSPALDLRPGGILAGDDARVDAALADLAVRLDRDPDRIDVLDAREVTWRDGSVGCPSPGQAYPQALVPGFLVVLRSDDASYRYHSAGDLMPFLCETPESPMEGSA